MERRSIRLVGYDYSMAGYYALTICARDKAHLFGVLCADEQLKSSSLGDIVRGELLNVPTHHPTVRLDAWVLMPNHLHMILIFTKNQVEVLSQVVGGFKSRCFQRWRARLLAAGQPAPASCWQRNYYEHIIRNLTELEAYRRYIDSNPSRWNTL